jgi:hypothetical protein
VSIRRTALRAQYESQYSSKGKGEVVHMDGDGGTQLGRMRKEKKSVCILAAGVIMTWYIPKHLFKKRCEVVWDANNAQFRPVQYRTQVYLCEACIV